MRLENQMRQRKPTPSFSPSIRHLSPHIFFLFFPLLFNFFCFLSSFFPSLHTLFPLPFLSLLPNQTPHFTTTIKANDDRFQSLAFKGGQHPRLRDPALRKPLLNIWWRQRPRLALRFQTPVVHHPSFLHFLHLDIDPFPSGRNGRVPVVYGQDLSSCWVAFRDGFGV